MTCPSSRWSRPARPCSRTASSPRAPGSQAGNEDIATRFLRASFQGWIWCRDNFDACVQVVLDNGPTLGAGHQTWQLNEINALIWPSPAGIGMMDAAAFDRTVDVAIEGEVITAAPAEGVYRTDLADGRLGGSRRRQERGELPEGGHRGDRRRRVAARTSGPNQRRGPVRKGRPLSLCRRAGAGRRARWSSAAIWTASRADGRDHQHGRGGDRRLQIGRLELAVDDERQRLVTPGSRPRT